MVTDNISGTDRQFQVRQYISAFFIVALYNKFPFININ